MKRKRNSEEASTSNYLPSLEATSQNFDVFLSFRGPDTRDKFTSHLYERLTCVGISVFKDDVKMVKGEGINEALRTAIHHSRICIPIFSKNYARSKACLQELCHMVLAHKSIIPIFYDVGADDVKLKTDLYKEALEDHHREGKVGQEEIGKWKKALLEVAKILGYNIVNKNEADEITKITREVLNRLMPKNLIVTNHLVEIDDEVESVIKMLDMNSNSCRIIGLCGMGGIGKTTLAKVVFNRLSTNFDNCCTFIANVRESVQNNELPKLQQQLYKDLINPRFTGSIDNINSGINMIEKGLENKRFLLVLDDMDDQDLLTNFVGHHLRFAYGSRIIITTRNRRVLDALEKKPMRLSNDDQALLEVYQVQQLDDNRALQLFSKHAFRSDSPPENFKSLSEAVISSLGGLPLALEVLGSLLLGRDEKAWEEIMDRLKETSDKKIQTSLMISYHELHKDEQNIFLDIACYPGSLQKTGAYYMWESCRWHPTVSIDNLVNQSLIKVDKNECLWMHDVLKDLGRDIIREEHKRNGREVKRFLQIGENFGKIPNEERKYVEMLKIDKYHKTVIINDLEGFENVRFLELTARNLEGNFEELFPNLRWFSISYVKYCTTANFNPENLVVLQLHYPQFNVVDFFWSQIKAHRLKVLEIISLANMEQTPSFKEFSSLEVLTLKRCLNLVNSIGDLKRLIRLNIEEAKYPASLEQTFSHAKTLEDFVLMGHGSVCNLQNLLQLCLIAVRMKELKVQFGNLVSLRELDISYSCINALPNEIGQLKELRILRISASQITKFPTTIRSLRKLEVLEARHCTDFEGEIPDEISMLSCLRSFDLRGTPIYRMPKLPSSLTHLIIDSKVTHLVINSKLTLIEIYSHNLFELVNIVELELRWQYDFNILNGHPKCLDFQWIWKLSMLKKLNFCIPYTIIGLESVNRLSQIEELNLSFVELQGNLQLPSKLLIVDLYDCKFDILDVSCAKKLRVLTISACDVHEIQGLRDLDSLIRLRVDELRSLSSLKVWNCKSLRQIYGFHELESLTDLSIRDCPSLYTIPYVSKLMSLSSLEIWNCQNLKGSYGYQQDCLTHLSIKNLEIDSLELITCGKLKKIEGLDTLKSLISLSIEDCPSLESMPGLSMLRNLESLNLCNLERLGCIEGLDTLKSLIDLSIEDCPSLINLLDLSNLRNLESLNLCNLERLVCIEGLDTLKSLIDLSIEDCPSLTNLLDLSKLRNLEYLTLHSLERLRCIEGLDTLKSLIDLSIEDCPSLTNLLDLSKLRNLESLKLCELERLGCIKGLTQLEFLKEVYIIGCQSLELEPDDPCKLNNTSVFVKDCDKLLPQMYRGA